PIFGARGWMNQLKICRHFEPHVTGNLPENGPFSVSIQGRKRRFFAPKQGAILKSWTAIAAVLTCDKARAEDWGQFMPYSALRSPRMIGLIVGLVVSLVIIAIIEIAKNFRAGSIPNAPAHELSKEACEKWSAQSCEMLGGRWFSVTQVG